MSFRLYWTPIIFDPEDQSYKAKIDTHRVGRTSHIIPTNSRYTPDGDLNPDAGKPRHTHAMSIVRASNWTAIESDPEEILLGEFPEGQKAIDRIKSATVADIPAALRANWSLVLTSMGARVDDINGSTPVVKVLRRLMYRLDQQVWEGGLDV